MLPAAARRRSILGPAPVRPPIATVTFPWLRTEERLAHQEVGVSANIVRTTKRSGFYRMPDGAGHYFARLPVGRVWGQIHLVHFLTLLSAKWHVAAFDRPFGLGDLANEDGSAMTDHVSHSTGMGVDIFVFNRDPLKRRSGTANVTVWYDRTALAKRDPDPVNPAYDRELTTKLMQLMAQLSGSFPMIQCLYNDRVVLRDPEVRKMNTNPGELRPHPNHDEHIHVLLKAERKYKYTKDEIEALLRIRHTL
jgi:murein endopeptidase